jgi:site-specific DNA-methyltransferase (adenine-specific)
MVSKPNRIERQHPCPRPLDSVEQITQNFTIEDAKILDPFMGSGTTGLAAKNLGRAFVGIESNEKYFNIATERLK